MYTLDQRIIFNEQLLSQFNRICKETGFLNDHIASQDGGKYLLSNEIFTISDQSTLRSVLNDYHTYTLTKTTKNGVKNKYYQKTQQLLSKEPQIQNALREIGINDEENQITVILSLSIFYHYINSKAITIIIQRLLKVSG